MFKIITTTNQRTGKVKKAVLSPYLRLPECRTLWSSPKVTPPR